MDRKTSTRRTRVGGRGARDGGNKAWDTPRLTTIASEDAESALTVNSDGLYAAS